MARGPVQQQGDVVLHAVDSSGNPVPLFGSGGAAYVADVAVHPGEDATLDAQVTRDLAEYEVVPLNSTAGVVLGSTGAIGDYIDKLIITVQTAASALTQIKDGSGSAVTVLPNSPGGGVGVYVVPLGIKSTAGAWTVITNAGSNAIATGNFT